MVHRRPHPKNMQAVEDKKVCCTNRRHLKHVVRERPVKETGGRNTPLLSPLILGMEMGSGAGLENMVLQAMGSNPR